MDGDRIIAIKAEDNHCFKLSQIYHILPPQKLGTMNASICPNLSSPKSCLLSWAESDWPKVIPKL